MTDKRDERKREEKDNRKKKWKREIMEEGKVDCEGKKEKMVNDNEDGWKWERKGE